MMLTKENLCKGDFISLSLLTLDLTQRCQWALQCVTEDSYTPTATKEASGMHLFQQLKGIKLSPRLHYIAACLALDSIIASLTGIDQSKYMEYELDTTGCEPAELQVLACSVEIHCLYGCSPFAHADAKQE